jgi:hypothetical protein
LPQLVAGHELLWLSVIRLATTLEGEPLTSC